MVAAVGPTMRKKWASSASVRGATRQSAGVKTKKNRRDWEKFAFIILDSLVTALLSATMRGCGGIATLFGSLILKAGSIQWLGGQEVAVFGRSSNSGRFGHRRTFAARWGHRALPRTGLGNMPLHRRERGGDGAKAARRSGLFLYWCSIGALLVLYWCSIGALLVLYWCSIGRLLAAAG
jgi:hypothetical protein